MTAKRRSSKEARRWYTAVHEAGHVVADCHFGRGIHHAQVNPDGMTCYVDDKGREVEHELGHVQSSLQDIEPAIAELQGGTFSENLSWKPLKLQRRYRQLVPRRLICIMAGSIAEARAQKRPLWLVQDEGGESDMQKVYQCLRYYAPRPAHSRALFNYCEKAAKTFLREPNVWARVEKIAATLANEGRMRFNHPLIADLPEWQPLPPGMPRGWLNAARAAMNAIPRIDERRAQVEREYAIVWEVDDPRDADAPGAAGLAAVG